MLTKPEAERIAAAVSALRPDWSEEGVLAILGDERLRIRRTYRDTAVAFIALAADPESAKPTRIFEHGPWWEATKPAVNTSDLLGHNRTDDCAECGRPREGHHEPDHAYRRPNTGVGMPEKVRAEIDAVLGRTKETA